MIMTKSIIMAVSFVIILAVSISYSYDEKNMPKDGFVPNAETAIAIAEAVCIPIYGKEKINDEQPFKANLMDDGSWYVEGKWNHASAKGGTVVVKIRKSDGKILEVNHGK